MKNIHKYFQFWLALVCAVIVSFLAYWYRVNLASSQDSSVVSVSEEQVGIRSVRNAKTSVVSIVGLPAKGNSQTGLVSGTGFIVDSSGYILSNSHVIENPNYSYRVQLYSGQTYQAQLIGLDKYADVGVLKIEAQNLKKIPLGDSDALETGQTVFAIGYSLGRYQNTVTRGVVSGLGRNISSGTKARPSPRLQNLVQTDAAINPGNSGGPLINLKGEVVGMNTLIDSGGQGIGFAIPANSLKDLYTQIRLNGKVSRPYMGINFVTIDESIRFIEGITENQGALVYQVEANSPASKAGLKPRDIIIAINGESITEENQLDIIIQKKYKPGNTVSLQVKRRNQSLRLSLVLSESN